MPRTSSVGWLGCGRTASHPGNPKGVAETGHHAAPAATRIGVLVTHPVAHRRGHLGVMPNCQRGEAGPSGLIGEQ